MLETSSSNYTHLFWVDDECGPQMWCSEAREWTDENGIGIQYGLCPHDEDPAGGPRDCHVGPMPKVG